MTKSRFEFQGGGGGGHEIVITFPSPDAPRDAFLHSRDGEAIGEVCISSIYAHAYLGVKRVTATQISCLPVPSRTGKRASDIASDHPPDPIPANL